MHNKTSWTGTKTQNQVLEINHKNMYLTRHDETTVIRKKNKEGKNIKTSWTGTTTQS
jgi:hypothetical protein